LKNSLRAIERAFAELESAVDHLATRIRHVESKAEVKAASANRGTIRLTGKRRAQLKLQGAYMGYMRQLNPAQKARVKAVKARRGFEAAIRVARKSANGRRLRKPEPISG